MILIGEKCLLLDFKSLKLGEGTLMSQLVSVSGLGYRYYGDLIPPVLMTGRHRTFGSSTTQN